MTRHSDALDAGPATGRDDIKDVPSGVLKLARRIRDDHMAAHNGQYPPTASYSGSNSERQRVGRPSHCSVCAIVGHVTAHPERGCSDVGCYQSHDEPRSTP